MITLNKHVIPPFEVVERKGLGHPDTLADGISEAICRSLCRFYLDEFGRVLHHNVDKVLIIAGKSAPRFGGGTILKPPSVVVGGRATRPAGCLLAAVPARAGQAGGRGVVVAWKPAKVGGAKDARKVDACMPHDAKHDPDEVPARAVLPGEANPYGWVERAVWTERMLDALRCGGPEGGRWYWLHDKVFAEKTLRAAFARVERNAGSPGVDGVTVRAFGNRLDEEIARLRSAWKDGKYRPQPIRRPWISKPGRIDRRPLGIPRVRDRVVQAALVLVLEPIFDSTVSEHSHGFRPGRSAHGALQAVLGHLEAGLTKSTVDYYLRDSNELIDLAVQGFLDALADHAAKLIAAAPDGREALHALVRIFTTGEAPPVAMTDPTLWSDFATHAWRRGALDELALFLDTFRSLFEQALTLTGVDNVHWRARSIHLYLLGTLDQKLVAPVPRDEVAFAVSALAGFALDPKRC